jgi:hypothetical protein
MDEPAPPTPPPEPEAAVTEETAADAALSDAVLCPSCGTAISIEPGAEQPMMRCPNCDADFFWPEPGENDESAGEWEEPADADSELDGMRIRKLVQVRRSAMRARSYAVIIMLCCLVMAAQLILTNVEEIRGYGWDAWAILYAVCAGLMVIGATVASGRAAVLHREARRSDKTDPAQPPHFEQLSDGTHHVTNLEQMHQREDAEG